MRRQGMSYEDIATAMDKTVRAVSQQYLKLVPSSASSGKRRKVTDVEMTESMKVKLLAAVAKAKPTFWATVAKEVGNGISPSQCEIEWNAVIKDRK